ncbi:methyltransferase domain-containing protein [Paracoccus sp. S-4012]|nr:methyltransferase domain-containing protein [Paracoccus sp. S-4012]
MVGAGDGSDKGGQGGEARPRRAAPPKPAVAAVEAPARKERRKPRSAKPPVQAPVQKPRNDSARAGALRLLGAVRDGASLDAAAEALTARLPPPDRARARRLAATALRHRGRAEAVLAPLLPRRPKPAIADVLLLGVTEMHAFGEAPHGVVNEAVALARKQGQKGAAAAGMVNAVLRRAAEAGAVWAGAAPVPLPDWIRDPVAEAWGEDAASAIEAAHERGAPLDLTAKPGREVAGATRLPTGSFRLPAGGQVSALPGFAEGDWWVQDAAAALPARLLDPRPGERIADLCAAPGGKTLQLAAAGALVTAVDLSPQRLERVAENLARCGLQAELVAADAREWRPEAPLDAILLDAPCSATGTIRRHPELPLIRDGSGIAALAALQDELIDHALALLPPGARLVFATCSLLPEEGEARLAAALARHPGLSVEAPDAAALGIEPGWITPDGAIRLRPDLWPERGGLDGFFMVRLRKSAEAT